MSRHTRLTSVQPLPEGCAVGDLTSHATEKEKGTSHVHSTRTTGVRASCAAINGERASGRARHVRGACARPPIADHVRCARAVSGLAQLTCATCADSLGTGCEVTFTRLTCGNSAGYGSSGVPRCPLPLRYRSQRNPPVKGVVANLNCCWFPDPVPFDVCYAASRSARATVAAGSGTCADPRTARGNDTNLR